MDLSLNFAADDAPARGKKAKPSKAGNQRRPQQQQQQYKAASTKVYNAPTQQQEHAQAASSAPASAPRKSNPIISQRKSAAAVEETSSNINDNADAAGAAGPSSSARNLPAHASATGKAQVISSLFPRLPSGRRKEMAVEEEEQSKKQQDEASSTVLDPSNAPSMSDDFHSLPLHGNIIAHLKGKMALSHPTTIQKLAVPFLCNKETRQKDAMLQAQTGSGKTLSYLLPIVQDLLNVSQKISATGKQVDRSLGTMAIILVPTRELANQIFEVACRLLSFPSENGTPSHRWITPGLLTGGAHRAHEKARLRKGVPLLIATPGRLLDHLETTKAFRIAGEVVRKPKDPSSRNQDAEDIDSDDEFAVEDALTAEPPAASDGEDDISSDEDFEGKAVSRSHRSNAPLSAASETAINPQLTLRWLVLDEADRLMDMGFEPQITSIVNILSTRLDKRRASLARALNRTDVRSRLAGQKRKYIELDQRRTLLCSATIQENVQKLAGVALKDSLLIKGDSKEQNGESSQNKDGSTRYAPPSQLSQSYAIVEPKLRFVALVALLRQLLLPSTSKRNGTAQKILVFLSCTDSVDLHWNAMANLTMGREADEEAAPSKSSHSDGIRARSDLLPKTSVFRLHGSLDLKTRLASLKEFAQTSKGPAVLFCTSVAARGLDVPDVNCVIQYDLPTEGGVTEYVHRVGRTARAGAGGQSWVMLLPSETGWVDWAEREMSQEQDGTSSKRLVERSVQSLLKGGYGGHDSRDYETRATDVQMAYERWVAGDSSNLNLARKAFSSHVRAYATHPSGEKAIFHVKNLHLGHLAKAFGLREAPAGIGAGSNQKKMLARGTGPTPTAASSKRKRNDGEDSDDSDEVPSDPKKPAIPRSGRALDGKGLHGPKGVTRSDFNIANTQALEALVNRKGIRR